MARRNQARPKPMILQKGDAGIRIILDSSGIKGDFFSDMKAARLRASSKGGARGDLRLRACFFKEGK